MNIFLSIFLLVRALPRTCDRILAFVERSILNKKEKQSRIFELLSERGYSIQKRIYRQTCSLFTAHATKVTTLVFLPNRQVCLCYSICKRDRFGDYYKRTNYDLTFLHKSWTIICDKLIDCSWFCPSPFF